MACTPQLERSEISQNTSLQTMPLQSPPPHVFLSSFRQASLEPRDMVLPPKYQGKMLAGKPGSFRQVCESGSDSSGLGLVWRSESRSFGLRTC
jgi:hypothetical protein